MADCVRLTLEHTLQYLENEKNQDALTCAMMAAIRRELTIPKPAASTDAECVPQSKEPNVR